MVVCLPPPQRSSLRKEGQAAARNMTPVFYEEGKLDLEENPMLAMAKKVKADAILNVVVLQMNFMNNSLQRADVEIQLFPVDGTGMVWKSRCSASNSFLTMPPMMARGILKKVILQMQNDHIL